jgi:hypothetical protein
MSFRRLFDFSPQARLWCQIALFMFLFGLLAAGNGFGVGKMLEGVLFALGFFVLPFVALLLGIAALSEPYHLPRATLWALATGVLAGGSLAASILLAIGSETGNVNASAFWFGCCLPMLIPPLGVGMYFIVRAWKEAQQEAIKAREARAQALIQTRGAISLSDLAAEMRLPAEEAEALVQSLVENRTLFGGLFDAPHGTVYSPEAFQAKQEQLADLTKAQPALSLSELAGRTGVPRELAHGWLRQLAQAHRIAGYLGSQDEVFHRVAREQRAELTACPSCGAAWSGLGAAQVTECPACKAEILL